MTRVRAGRLAGVLAAAGLMVAGCGSAGSPAAVLAPSAATNGIRGDQLSSPLSLPAAARFTDTTGAVTTLGALQAGHLMLVYFGYTHCPDECPTTMSDLAAAVATLTPALRARTLVVFITSDPARDTPAVLGAWLHHFSPDFVGLTASLSQIDGVAAGLDVPLTPPSTAPDGTVTVGHGTQTIAFRNGAASVLWLSGTPVADYAHDLALLAR